MLIFDFPHPAMISCIIAIMAFIPIFGAIIGAVIGAFIIFLISPIKALWFLVFIIILQQVESNVIYPKMMGHKVGLPSLWIIVSVMLGGGLFGMMGIIICVPLASVIYTLLTEWILKRLREKKLCKQNATTIPDTITPLSDEEFIAEDTPTTKETKSQKNTKKKNSKNNKH